MSFQAALFCWVCQMLHKTSFQINLNIFYSIIWHVNTMQYVFPNYQHVFYQWSKPGFRVTVTLATQGVVWIRCGFWRSVRVHTVPPAIALKYLTYLPSTQLFLTLKLKDRLRELVQLCFIKNNGQCRYKYLVLRSYFVKKTFWFSQFFFWNWYHQHARVFDWQHFCYVWWMCFSTDSPLTYGYKLCSSLTFSFICMRQTYFKHILLSYKTRQTSYRGFSRKIKRS
jgi:hypothetical protein